MVKKLQNEKSPDTIKIQLPESVAAEIEKDFLAEILKRLLKRELKDRTPRSAYSKEYAEAQADLDKLNIAYPTPKEDNTNEVHSTERR